jgi:hypothetical protein
LSFVSNFVVAIPFAGLLSGLGLAWMGYAVWSRPPAAAEPRAPMAASERASAAQRLVSG